MKEAYQFKIVSN